MYIGRATSAQVHTEINGKFVAVKRFLKRFSEDRVVLTKQHDNLNNVMVTGAAVPLQTDRSCEIPANRRTTAKIHLAG